MRKVFAIFACLILAACNHASAVSESKVTVMPATYALSSTATASAQTLSPNQERLTSSECAQNFDSTLSYLEYLMEQEQLKKNSAL